MRKIKLGGWPFITEHQRYTWAIWKPNVLKISRNRKIFPIFLPNPLELILKLLDGSSHTFFDKTQLLRLFNVNRSYGKSHLCLKILQFILVANKKKSVNFPWETCVGIFELRQKLWNQISTSTSGLTSEQNWSAENKLNFYHLKIINADCRPSCVIFLFSFYKWYYVKGKGCPKLSLKWNS